MKDTPILDQHLNTEKTIFAHQYAGFWQRLAANIIDHLIMGLVQLILTLMLVILFGALGLISFQLTLSVDGMIILFISGFFYLAISRLLLWWLYYAYCESKYGATIGKEIMGLKVTDLAGKPISFKKASGRFFGRLISFVGTLWIGYLIAAFTDKKQALHDIIGSCLVLKNYPTAPIDAPS